MADARLGVLMSAKNETNAAFAQLKNNIRETEAAAQGAKGGGFMASLTSQLGGLGGALAGVGVAFGAMQVGEAVVDMAKTAAQVGVLRDSLEGLAAAAGTSGDAIVSALQRASGGAISEQSLILAANRSMLLGVADSAEEMASLMEVAIVRGRAMGLSAEQAFSDLVTGIGRMSPMILDNLGIVTGGEKVFDDYAAALGRTADQLTDVERKQALVNTVISSSASLVAQAGDISETVSSFDQYQAAISDLKVSLGEMFAPAVTEGARALAQAIREVNDALTTTQVEAAQQNIFALGEALTEVSGKYQAATNNLALAQFSGNTEDIRLFAQDIEWLSNELAALGETYNRNAATTKAPLLDLNELRNGVVAFQDLSAAAGSASAPIQGVAGASQQMANEAGNAALAVQALSGQLGWMGSVALSQVGAIEQLSGAIAGLQMRMFGMAGVFSGMDGMKQSAISQLESQALEAVRGGANPDAIAGMFGAAADEIFNYSLSTEASAEAQLKNKIAIDRVAQSAGAQIGAIQKSLDANKEFAESYEQLGRSAQQAGANIASGLVPTVGVDAALGKAEELTGQTQAQIDAWLQAGYGIEQIESVLLPSYLDSLREANTLAVAHGGAVDNIGTSYDDLKGKVQGVVSEALNLDVGISPDDFLPREDAVNENARRLAAIMRDGLVGQPWLEEFKAEVPALFAELAASDDPRQAAANMLKQFEAGMRPELLDKGKAKEIVRNMLLGEAATGALVDEIAGELAAELGISIEKAKAAAGASLGIPQPTATEPVSLQIAPPAPVVVPMSYGTPEDAVLPTIEPVVVGVTWGELPEWTPPESLPSVVIPVSFDTEAYVLPTIEPMSVGLVWGTIPEWTQPEIPTATIPVLFSTDENLESGISAISASFTAGMESVNAGAKLAGQITAQLSGAASLAGFKNAGVSAAGTWGDAFLSRVSEGVPAQLINMLVSLITPEIQAQQQQVATRTGAAI